MIDWNNLKCPLCGDGDMKKEPFIGNATYVILDDNVKSAKDIKTEVYVCNACRNMLFRKR